MTKIPVNAYKGTYIAKPETAQNVIWALEKIKVKKKQKKTINKHNYYQQSKSQLIIYVNFFLLKLLYPRIICVNIFT